MILMIECVIWCKFNVPKRERGSSRTFLILLYSDASVQGVLNRAEIVY